MVFCKTASSAVALTVTLTVLAGCGGGSTGFDFQSGTQTFDGATSAAHPHRERSWMAPDAQKQLSLLYISNAGSSSVTVYTYLNGGGLLLVGTLTGFSSLAGMCSDSAGDVWITDYRARKIFEYAHGGTTPIFTIGEHTGFPYDCAVDPTTGDLAVSHQHPNGHYQAFGDVVVYPKGSRKGVAHTISPYGFSDVFFVAYDNMSNLYVDGTPCGYWDCYTGSEPAGLFTLVKNGSDFTPLTLSGATLYQPGAISWVSPTLLLGDQDFQDQGTSGAYKLFVSGSTATLVGSLSFDGTQQAGGFWRRAGRVIVPDRTGNAVRVYNLSDGSLFSTLTTGISSPFGAVVSESGR